MCAVSGAHPFLVSVMGSVALTSGSLARVILPEPAAFLDVGLLPATALLALPVVPRGKLQRLLRFDPALQLPAAFEFRVELRTEQERDVRDPQPQQQHDDAADAAVGLVVVGEVGDVEEEAQ